MSDLSNFKIQGTVDDDFSEHVKTGTKVYVGIDNEKLAGVVGTVSPVIRDRKIEFDVNLQESNHPRLRPKRSVNLDIVRAERDSVLRIPLGPAIGRGRVHQVFVLKGTQVKQQEIKTGLRSDEFVEILEGLNEGDRVVLTDISSAEELEQLDLH